MKSIKYKFIFLLSIIAAFTFSSCSNDNNSEGWYFTDEIATVNTIDEEAGTYYLTLDNGKTVWPAATSVANFKPNNNQRVVVRFTLLSDQTGGYDYYAKVIYIYDILTKEIINLTAENKDEIGNDPVKILALWAGNDYLNIRFGYNTGGEKAHTINLVRNTLSSVSTTDDGTIVLEFRHNANGDPQKYGNNVYGSFNLKPFKVENKNSVKFVIKVLDLDNQTKEYPITYTYK